MAAGALFVDQCDRKAEVLRIQGGGVAAGPAAHYHDVRQPVPFDGTADPSLVVPGVTLPEPMQTRWLLIVTAVLGFVIIGAAAVWLLVAFT